MREFRRVPSDFCCLYLIWLLTEDLAANKLEIRLAAFGPLHSIRHISVSAVVAMDGIEFILTLCHRGKFKDFNFYLKNEKGSPRKQN